MKKNLVRILALLLIAAMLLPLCARAEENTAEEDTEQTVYEEYPVSTAEDLEKLAELCRLDSASKNLKVILNADIDLKDMEDFQIPTFGGIFDGQNHKLYGLVVNQDGSAQGLFRYIQEGATVKNLEIIGRVGLKDIKTCAAGAAELLSGGGET